MHFRADGFQLEIRRGFIEFTKRPPKGFKTPRGLHIGTFQKYLFMPGSRKLGVRLLDLLVYGRKELIRIYEI